MSDTTVSIYHADLIDALASVMPHTGTDSLLPVFTWMKIDIAHDGVTFLATDRYTMARDTIPLVSKDSAQKDNVIGGRENNSILLDRNDLKNLVSALKRPKSADIALSQVTFEMTGDGFITIGWNFGDNSTRLRLQTGHDYPSVNRILDGIDEFTGEPMRRFTPEFLTRIAVLSKRLNRDGRADRNTGVDLTFGKPGGMVQITFGDTNFKAAIMSQRVVK